jgi:hypothetical protein
MHGGKVQNVPSGPRVFINGADPVATAVDTFTIAGCPFSTPATGPMPCLTVTWITPALRVTSMGRALLLQTSVGTTNGPTMAPQGAPLTSVNQPRVVAM